MLDENLDLERELERRLDVVFDGRSWALRYWVRQNLGREVAHELPGLVVSFNQLRHEVAVEVERRGMTRTALGLLSSRSSGGWVLHLAAAVRYVVPLLAVVGVASFFGLPVALLIGIAVGVLLVPEVGRWRRARTEPGLRVSAAGPLVVVGSVVLAVALAGTPEAASAETFAVATTSSVPSRRVAKAEAVAVADLPAAAQEQPSPASGGPWPKYDPYWDEVPKCMADAMRDQRAKGRKFVALDRVEQPSLAIVPPRSGIDFHRYVNQTVEVVACCATCGATFKDVFLVLGAPAVQDESYILGVDTLAHKQRGRAESGRGKLQAMQGEIAVEPEHANLHLYAEAWEKEESNPERTNRSPLPGEILYFAIVGAYSD